ncbi:DUF4258 domain-containing protein [Gordonia phosphorivorans]|uniref:DUF4258 domain-containing protein n=1 Tax=Gordonia phosphorivorans TaxID=1056982 RepID=A0ABV6H793_9ACTN
MVHLQITAHARRQCQRRKITEADIVVALRACHLHREGDNSNWVHQATVDDRELGIVTVERSCTGTLTVVTAWWRGE